MIGRIFTAYLMEIVKAVRLKSTFIGPGLVMLAIAMTPLVHPLEHDGASDYDFIAYATPMALNLLGFLVLLIYCAGLVSTELSTGTICMALVRPLRRREFLAAKLLMGMTYAAALSLLAALTAWGIAYALGDLSGVRSGGEVIYTDTEMRLTFCAALLMNLLPQFAAVAYTILISTCTRSTSAAIGSAVGIWIFLDFLKYPLGLAPFLFSSYMESSWQVFADRCNALEAFWLPTAYYGALTSVLSMILLFGSALFVLSRRNLCT